MIWPRDLNKKIKRHVKLSSLTTLRIGGEAEFFAEASGVEELRTLLSCARRSGRKVFILGAGSNVLVSDSGLRGLVVRFCGKPFKSLKADGVFLEAGAGVGLNRLAGYAKENGLSGLEFLAGIPGTLGGALAGNAGAWGKSICPLVHSVSVLDREGRHKTLSGGKIRFSYRRSNLGGYAILSCRFRLRKGEGRGIDSRMRGYILRRRKTQKDTLPNAGCVFRNPGERSAGMLIDSCGLKGVSRGGAVISRCHANFILNRGGAASGDVLSLMRLMRRKVKDKFKIRMEPEIKIWK
ncbi:MAG: UDP-N-acetylmuramate dehydrogenase [Candidatus Omnitrophica bacterium]|nr:UDP-N-acetylmuramate dehydrogenase [Candidatus Omnitrophota bacterium]